LIVGISSGDALKPLSIPRDFEAQDGFIKCLSPSKLTDLTGLFHLATMKRHSLFGDGIEFCAIVNARSGRCSEDCAYCAQSARYPTHVKAYPMMEAETIVSLARKAADDGAVRFGIVTSGRGCPTGTELDTICRAVERMRRENIINPCASLGLLTDRQARRLVDAGLIRYHHNLEASESFFPSICTTHTFEERMQTVLTARQAGLEVCVGGIVGMGESPRERLELAETLARLSPESVPLNFLTPIPGTPLANKRPITALEALGAVGVFSLLIPGARLRTCGGRHQVLGRLSPFMYLAGASATMIGNYLTTSGPSPAEELEDISSLGLRRIEAL